MNVTTKYIKDETGTNISPVTSTSSIYTDGGKNLNNYLYEETVLFEGSTLDNLNFEGENKLSNFQEIDIYYCEPNKAFEFIRIPFGNNRLISTYGQYSDGDIIYFSLGDFMVHDTAINNAIQHRLHYQLPNGPCIYDNAKCISIRKVVGRKKLLVS